MRRHLAYLKYLMRHKWYVLQAAFWLPCSLWLAFWHDWSKFLPGEWLPYARNFYLPDGRRRPFGENDAFTLAWMQHQRRNKHHWQAWVCLMDDGSLRAVPMPRKYVVEMIADWCGAGRAIHGSMDPRSWYAKNKDRMILHEATMETIEGIFAWNFSVWLR